MKKITAIKPMSKGFGLLEIIIALAITAILSTAGITVYNDHIVKTNRVAVQDDLLELAADFGKYYTQKGTYAADNGGFPKDVASVITAANTQGSNGYNQYYKLEVYSPQLGSAGQLSSNTQSVCLVAKPRDGTVMANSGDVIVDSYGNVTVGSHANAASLCGSQVPDPFPEPTNDSAPNPNVSPQPPGPPSGGCASVATLSDAVKYAAVCCTDNSFLTKWTAQQSDICNKIDPDPSSTPTSPDGESSVTPTPTATPTSTPTNTPASDCDQVPYNDDSKISWTTDSGSGNCKIDPNTHIASGSCKSVGPIAGFTGGCSNCLVYIDKSNNPTEGACADCIIVYKSSSPGTYTGSMDRGTLCNAAVSVGSTNNTTIVGGPNMKSSVLCYGSCASSNFIVSPNAVKGPIVTGSASASRINVPETWGDYSAQDACSNAGNPNACYGISVNKY